jgi:hypothetical protein
MLSILQCLLMVAGNIFKSRRRFEAENLFLRHHLDIALSRRLCVPKTSSALNR